MKFKVGDRVRITRPWYMDRRFEGDVVTITKVLRGTDGSSERYYVKENNRPWVEGELTLEKEFKMTKEDLKNGDIVTLRNGDKLVYGDGRFQDITDKHSNPLAVLRDLDEDMTYNSGDGNEQHDIVKVERPVEYETVFEREEVQELTVDEISERLGYKVKVVGEDK